MSGPYTAKDFLLDDHFLEWVRFPSPENEAYWQEFQRTHPTAAPAMNEARLLLQQMNFTATPRSAETKERIKRQIDRRLRTPRQPPSGRRFGTARRHWLRVAAGVAGLLLLTGLYAVLNDQSTTQLATAYGETRVVVLPDESVVTLNANSTLRWQDDDWKETLERRVWLTGEAFFDIRKTTTAGINTPFVVHTDEVAVNVLGTTFNVRARHQETEVVLRSGQVKLTLPENLPAPEPEVLMEPGDRVAVSKTRREVTKTVVDPAYYTAWKENKLVFKNTPVAEIVQLIEDNYGYRVVVPDKTLLTKAFTGSAPADNLSVLLDKMSVVYNLSIQENANEIILAQ